MLSASAADTATALSLWIGLPVTILGLLAQGRAVVRRYRSAVRVEIGVQDLSKLIEGARAQFMRPTFGLSIAGEQARMKLAARHGDGRPMRPQDLIGTASFGAILLTGTRGSGKTSYLLALGEAVTTLMPEPTHGVRIEEYVRQTRIPLLANLSKWRDYSSFDGFLERELEEQYKLGRELSALLTREGALFLLLDGLDEVTRADSRKILIRGVEAYAKVHRSGAVVISSTGADDVDTGLFSLSRMQPLADADVLDYCEAAGDPGVSTYIAFEALAGDPACKGFHQPLFLELVVYSVELGEDVVEMLRGKSYRDALESLLQLYTASCLARTGSTESCSRTAVWLAHQLAKRGDCATFRIYELDPFWLPGERDVKLAFTVMGLLVTVPPAFMLAITLGLLGSPLWATTLIAAIGVLLGSLYRWAHTSIYNGFHRRRPQAVRRRDWSLDRFFRSLKFEHRAVWHEARIRMCFGLIGGFIFAGLNIVVQPGTDGSWLILTVCIAAIAIGLSLVCLPGILNQFVAAAIVGAVCQLGTGNLLADGLFSGIPLGFLSLLVFYGAEMGEFSSAEAARRRRPAQVFRANLTAQLWFELRQWVIFGVAFGLAELLIYRELVWLYGIGGSVVAAIVIYGLLGGLFPFLLYGTTIWRLKSRRVLGENLNDTLDQLVSARLLQRTVGGLGVRFIHPSVARLLGSQPLT